MVFEERTPDKIGRYEIVLEIARGGMATVYLARSEGHGGFDRYVALKLTAEHLRDDPSFAEHLVEEAKLVAHLRHPNVVPVLDVGVDESRAVFLVMEYVPGDSLGGLLRTARKSKLVVPPRVGLRVLLDALAGLHAAHEHADEDGNSHRLVHRDFSPQNILVGTDGVARLTDFGIAKAASRVSVSVVGAMKGKVSYASPEQARGLGVDRRCDVWAAAVVAWEVIAGRKLYPPTPRTLLDIVDKPPPRLRSVVPDVPQGIDEAIAQALQHDVTQRPATAQAFARMLSAAARDADMLADIEEVAEHVQRVVGPELEERKQKVAEARRQRSQAKPSAFPHVSTKPSFVPVAPLPSLPDVPMPQERVQVAAPDVPLAQALVIDGAPDVLPAHDLIDDAPDVLLASDLVTSDAPDVVPGVDRAARIRQRVQAARTIAARFLAERRTLVIRACAGAGVFALLAIVFFVIASDPEPTTDGKTRSTGSAKAPAASAPTLAEVAPVTTSSVSPAKAPLGEPAELPAQLEVTANLPIARVRVGKRVVDMEVAAPKIAIDLAPDETSASRLSVRVTSAAGHVASTSWEPGDSTLSVTFDESRPVRHTPKASGKPTAKKP